MRSLTTTVDLMILMKRSFLHAPSSSSGGGGRDGLCCPSPAPLLLSREEDEEEEEEVVPLLLLGSTITLVPPIDEEERLAERGVLSTDDPAWLDRLLSELVLVRAVNRRPSSASTSDCDSDTSPWLLLPLLESRES